MTFAQYTYIKLFKAEKKIFNNNLVWHYVFVLNNIPN